MELRTDRYYSITGTSTRGLKVYLPVVTYLGSAKSNLTHKWSDTFRRDDTGGAFSFLKENYELGPVDWEGEAKKLN